MNGNDGRMWKRPDGWGWGWRWIRLVAITGVLVLTAALPAFDDTVSVIDLTNLSALATVAVGKEPNGVSYSPRPPAAPTAATVTLDVPAPAPYTEDNPGRQPNDEHHGH